MSDPRASIHRTVAAPPTPVPRPSSTSARSADMSVGDEVRLIGKPHGRMRCVNLSLTREAKAALYAQADADGTTLGEALMDLAARAEVPGRRRRPDRAATMRRGVETVSVFVLLTPSEARHIVTRAEATGRSVSDYVSTAIG